MGPRITFLKIIRILLCFFGFLKVDREGKLVIFDFKFIRIEANEMTPHAQDNQKKRN